MAEADLAMVIPLTTLFTTTHGIITDGTILITETHGTLDMILSITAGILL